MIFLPRPWLKNLTIFLPRPWLKNLVLVDCPGRRPRSGGRAGAERRRARRSSMLSMAGLSADSENVQQFVFHSTVAVFYFYAEAPPGLAGCIATGRSVEIDLYLKC